MITNFLLDNKALLLPAMLLVAAVCVGVGYAVLRARPWVSWALVALSLVPVAALTLTPVLGRSFQFCAVQFAVPTLHSVESLANVALFVPPVFFATLVTRLPLVMLAAGTILSAEIEVFQGLVPEVGRACDTNDWAMNTAGAVVAVLLARATVALSDRVRTPQPGR